MLIFLALSAASLFVMTIVDGVLGPKAEFLNAYSVFQRIIGQAPAAGESVVARKLGAFGEFGAVLMVNLAIGAILTGVVRLVAKL